MHTHIYADVRTMKFNRHRWRYYRWRYCNWCDRYSVALFLLALLLMLLLSMLYLVLATNHAGMRMDTCMFVSMD